MQAAVDEAYAKGYLGEGIFGSEYDLELTVHLGAGAYICGEETALINSLEGFRGEPRLKPPYFPAAKGLYMMPTIVNNVETVSNLPHVLGLGAKEYSSLTGSEDTGTFLMSLSGHVNQPGNYELPHGITWRELIYDVGGGIPGGKELKAWIPGGASAPWFIPGEHLELEITKDATAAAGSMLGSGAVIVMDEDTCTVRAAERVVRFFSHESCGQCTPCREGTTWLEMILQRIEQGQGRAVDLDLMLDVSDGISIDLAWPPKMTTICPLGPSAVSPILALRDYFRSEVDAHVAHGGCPFLPEVSLEEPLPPLKGTSLKGPPPPLRDTSPKGPPPPLRGTSPKLASLEGEETASLEGEETASLEGEETVSLDEEETEEGEQT